MKQRQILFLILLGFAILTLTGGASWAGAGGPAADFPSFIPFAGDLAIMKTGDVAIDKIGNIYVHVTNTSGVVQIWRFSPSGDLSIVADIGMGIAYGLALTANGDIYAAVQGTARGVYRIGPDGEAVMLPGTDQIVAANALAFDPQGNLYVTESKSNEPGSPGGIWRIARMGDAELMLRHELLTGMGLDPIGANGIAYYHGDLYVVNSNQVLIARIPVNPDGSLGEPEIWKELEEVPESLLAGSAFPIMGDGIALDVHGNVYVAMVTRFAVVRINGGDLSQETIAAFGMNPSAPLFAPLDTPNMLAFGTGKGGRQNIFVTNLGLIPGFMGRGVVKIEVGVPGLPLP